MLARGFVLPYYDQPHLDLGPFPIHAFGVLVGAAVMGGIELAARRAPKVGLEPSAVAGFAMWVVIPGFLGAHVFDVLWYHPSEFVREPSMLFDVFAGLSSFGGFLGAIVGAIVWRGATSEELLPFVDLVVSVFPISWALGRAGCTLAHDHPGVHTSADNPLAFAYPDGPRWDLGFLEMLFAIGLAVLFVVLWRRAQPVGTYLAAACLLYAPARFGLDFLRADVSSGGDARYGGITPAQVACVVLFAIGLITYRRVHEERGRARRTTSEPRPLVRAR